VTGAPFDEAALLEPHHVVVDAAGRREPDLAGDLPQARREAVLVVEAPQCGEHFSLPCGQVFHVDRSLRGGGAASRARSASLDPVVSELWMTGIESRCQLGMPSSACPLRPRLRYPIRYGSSPTVGSWMDAGTLLRQRRQAHGLSQRELAIRAGTRQATISRIENGHEIPTVQRLDQLLTALGERLELRAVSLDAERPAEEVQVDRARSMSERLDDGFALASFASQLAGTARR
jgi:transcriptional regulator with XRE-family HTH domain